MFTTEYAACMHPELHPIVALARARFHLNYDKYFRKLLMLLKLQIFHAYLTKIDYFTLTFGQQNSDHSAERKISPFWYILAM